MSDWHTHTRPADTEAPAAGALGTVMNWAGALMSLGLIAGLTVWGYQLAVRDVAGIPVVRALDGPMRIAPEDPGGELAAHQGLAVNTIAATGHATPAPDELILAPQPLSLTDEDLAGADLQLARTAPEQAIEPESRPAPAVPEAVEELAEDDPASVPERASPGEILPATVPGVARSPRPSVRPDFDLAASTLAARVADSVAESLVARGTGGVDPASLVPGTRLVQLGAFESEQIAVEEWARVRDRFGAVLGDRKRLIEKAESGGKTFYRLRVVGFDDLSDARRLCAVLTAENANCIPVVTR